MVSTIGAKLSGGKGRQCFSAIDGSVAPEPRRHRVRLSRCSKVQSGAIRRSSAAPIHQERQVRTGLVSVPMELCIGEMPFALEARWQVEELLASMRLAWILQHAAAVALEPDEPAPAGPVVVPQLQQHDGSAEQDCQACETTTTAPRCHRPPRPSTPPPLSV